ncbi:hypothetical protein [Limosilactobacillus mucosae]|uniref:Uncharacterized protein n=1 Tax=Limosilactobacillus mucosae TaxID=97478 RepID=A0AAJ1MA91_LIMMU|nr:hypothetical protein [Limosilactobacillus mucosae]MDC2828478.1 hypothetical protein [Limosilactobacillus mucosae]MDC2834376.1 hypothetical protein [Limosilactobacillus mucosae]
MAKQKKKRKLDRFSKIMITIIVAVSLALLGILILTIQNHKQASNTRQNDASSQSSAVTNSSSRKGKKASSRTSKPSLVSADKAKENIQQGLPFAFEVIKSIESLPGSQVDFNQLGSDNTKKLYTYFESPEPVQQFNDIANYSSPDGMLQHGDAGTEGNGQEQTPKPGDPYTIDQADINLVSQDNETYIFNVNLKYHANSDSPRTIPLKITSQKIDGKVVSIAQNGSGTYPE